MSIFLINLIMMGPNLVIYLEKNNYVYPVRMSELLKGKDQKKIGLKVSYDQVVKTGTPSHIGDFIHAFSPTGYENSNPRKVHWGRVSEANMYLGIIPLIIALIGLFWGRYKHKNLWVFLICSWGLFILGPPALIHKILFYIYPPVAFDRHPELHYLYYLFCLMFFYVLGANRIKKISLAFGVSFWKNLYNSWFSLSFFSMIIFVSVYKMHEVERSNQTDMPFYFCVIVVAAYVLKKLFGKEGIFCGIITGFISLVFFYA